MRSRKHHNIFHYSPEPANRLDEKKLSIERCQKILKKNGLTFSDKEVESIRDFLYLLAEIEYQHYKKNSHEEESNLVHTRFDR